MSNRVKHPLLSFLANLSLYKQWQIDGKLWNSRQLNVYAQNLEIEGKFQSSNWLIYNNVSSITQTHEVNYHQKVNRAEIVKCT